MPSYGVTVPVPATIALPPPVLIVLSLAPLPITAIERTLLLSRGRMFPLFFSRTVPSSAACLATATCAGVEASASGVSADGWSKSPNRNSSRRMRVTMSSTRLCATRPFCTACLSAAPKYESFGICMSMPALADCTVLCVPSQSEVMNPSKPNWVFKMLLR
jgi:hypothetical protein